MPELPWADHLFPGMQRDSGEAGWGVWHCAPCEVRWMTGGHCWACGRRTDEAVRDA